jgi:hypothetical protein
VSSTTTLSGNGLMPRVMYSLRSRSIAAVATRD